MSRAWTAHDRIEPSIDVGEAGNEGESSTSRAPALRALPGAGSREAGGRGRRAASPRTEDPLAQLASASAAGDRQATQELVRALSPAVLAVARRILGARDPEVEDAAQESLIAVVRALRGFRGDSSVAHYAKRIAARTCLNARKRTRSRGRQMQEYRQLDAQQRAPSPGGSPAAARRRRLMMELLLTLPIEQSETLTLRIVLGMSLAEVAGATGAPVNTVRSRIRLAKEALRKRIESEGTARELLGGSW